MKINFVDDLWKDDRKPGDAEYFYVLGEPEVRAGLHFICPGCRHLGAVTFAPPHKSGWTWDGNVESPTVKPSILHDKDGCGWHGYLTAGEFVSV